MRDPKDDIHSLPLYESYPADWLPKAHLSADLGYHGFYPPRPGQDEDVLSVVNVKNGLILDHCVPAETYSAQDAINKRFLNDNALTELEDLINQIFSLRADHAPPVPVSSFRMPGRVTLNDAKRQAWFADLANPEVPLQKLGKSVPHGAKGQDLLDLLHTNNVAIPRAVWFLRVFGANETTGLRNKPAYNPMQYSIEWANVVTGYMKKQLADIALPSTPRPGLNIKTTFKGVLGDADSRERWISRFSYCLKLLRTFYAEGLVDNRTFLTWLMQQMSTCNLAQAGFVARLADEYLDGLLHSRALTQPFVEACLSKFMEIRSTSTQDYLVTLELLLRSLLQRTCLSLPDAFVSPQMWKVHGALLWEILSSRIVEPASEVNFERMPSDIDQILLDNISDIKRRNEAMLFRNLSLHPPTRLGSAVADIQTLNSISSMTDLNAFPYFSMAADTDQTATFISKLHTLLTWSVSPDQYGDHRPFAAVNLLRIWRDKAEDRAVRRDITPPDEIIQDELFDWLDRSDAAVDATIESVALLFGKLVQEGLFSYANYIQRLIARGEPVLSFAKEETSRHRTFLRWIPLDKSMSSLISQRKVALYGARARDTPEDANEREIRKEVRAVLPDLFGGKDHRTFMSIDDLLAECSALVSAARFEQVRMFQYWLLPILRQAITNQAANTLKQLDFLPTYGVVVDLLAHVKSYDITLELSIFLLENACSTASVTAVTETIRRHAQVWACMQKTAMIVTALSTAHRFWSNQHVHSRALLELLMEMDNGSQLDAPSRERITADIANFAHSLQRVSDDPSTVPDVLPEILLLSEDPSPDAPSLLAERLWYKYMTSWDWGWKVWDNTVASLRQVPVMTSDIAGRRVYGLRYSIFLLMVDRHLPNGLDEQVLQWFIGTGKNEVAALNVDAWDVLTLVLMYLVTHGALRTTTVLLGLAYPAWQLGANASPEHSLEVFLAATNHLVRQLLFCEHGSVELGPPTDLLDVQRIRARRQQVYQDPHFSMLLTSVPNLVSIEQNEYLSEGLRSSSRSLRRMVCKASEFRQGANRNLDAVRDAFEQKLDSGLSDENFDNAIIDALGLIFCDTDLNEGSNIELSNLRDISSLIGPCKLSATRIQLHINLRQLSRALSKDATCQAATTKLEKLSDTVIRHSMLPEEAYFVAEMTGGIDGQLAGKFINSGFQRITDVMRDASFISVASPMEWIHRAGEILRVLAHIANPFREEPAQPLQLDPVVQDNFITTIVDKFMDLKSALTLNGDHDVPTQKFSFLTEAAIFLGRLLQFDLGFQGAWSTRTRQVAKELSMTVFRIALQHSTGESLDLVAYPLMIDTLYYLLDEIPVDSRAAVDPFRHYPDLLFSSLSASIPSEYRDQLRRILQPIPANTAVSDLGLAHRDPSGNLVPSGSPVQNRPWEWVENLGIEIEKDKDKDEDEKKKMGMRYLVKNSGSLSLETFGARITGDGIVRGFSAENAEEEGRIEGNVRTFEDALSAESVFKRDWRETRLEIEVDDRSGCERVEGEGEEEEDALFSSHGQMQGVKGRTGSPASSTRSRGSSSRITRRSMSTISEVVEVECAISSPSKNVGTGKRKGQDHETIEGSVSVRATKKVKTNSISKRAKK